MAADFPRNGYDRVFLKVRSVANARPQMFDHFGGAWNAISYRFMAMCFHGDTFSASIVLPQGPRQTYFMKRYGEERELFGFFSNSFSTFESFFYGMFSVGNYLSPYDFPMATAKDQQAVSPTNTDRAYRKAFPGDPILAAFTAVFSDTRFRELREIRNILTHRTAPARKMFVGIGSDEELPDRWKLNDIPLDTQLTPSRRANTAQLLGTLLNAAATFVEARIP